MYCYSLQSVPLFDTSNVKTMYQMFMYCYSLQSVLLFDTSNVTTMQKMFFYCHSLQSVPLFDTSNVTTMSQMFINCGALQYTRLQQASVSFAINQTNIVKLGSEALADSVKDKAGESSPSVTVRTGQLSAAAETTFTNKNWSIVEV
jgi:surface protein